MNLTLSVDERSVEKAREVARALGTSLQDLIRRYLESLADDDVRRKSLEELRAMWRESDRHLKGKGGFGKVSRDEIYAERIDKIGRKRG